MNMKDPVLREVFMKDVVMKDLIQAMKDRDARKKGVLQLLKAGLENAEKLKRYALDKTEGLEDSEKNKTICVG